MDLPDPGIKPGSPALQADSLPTEGIPKRLHDLLKATWLESGTSSWPQIYHHSCERRKTGFTPASWQPGGLLCVPLMLSSHFPFWPRVWTQTLHSGNGSHHSTLAKPLERDPDKPWWGDPVRSASWRLNSNKKLRRKNDTAKKEFQVLLTKTVEELFGERLVLFNIFLPWKPKNLDLSTSIHLLWHFFSKLSNILQL